MSLEVAIFIGFIGSTLIAVLCWCRSLILENKKLKKALQSTASGMGDKKE